MRLVLFALLPFLLAAVDADDHADFAKVATPINVQYGHMSKGAGTRNAFNYRSVMVGLTDTGLVSVTQTRNRVLVDIEYSDIRDVTVTYRGKKGAEVIVVADAVYRFDIFIDGDGSDFIELLRSSVNAAQETRPD